MVKSEQNSAVGAEEVDASSRDPQMFGDGMVGSSSDMNQGTTAGGQRTGRGQSPRSSEEAGNDRGAKGRRKVDAQWNRTTKENRREWRRRLYKPKKPETNGGGWNVASGRSAC